MRIFPAGLIYVIKREKTTSLSHPFPGLANNNVSILVHRLHDLSGVAAFGMRPVAERARFFLASVDHLHPHRAAAHGCGIPIIIGIKAGALSRPSFAHLSLPLGLNDIHHMAAGLCAVSLIGFLAFPSWMRRPGVLWAGFWES